jgi:hypothetical protein
MSSASGVTTGSPRTRRASARLTAFVLLSVLTCSPAVWADPVPTGDAGQGAEPKPVSYVRTFMPDLKLEDSPPSTSLTAFVGSHMPYQVGLGLAIDTWISPALRFGVIYAFGGTPSNKELIASHYAEALASVRVFHVRTLAAADLPLRPMGSDEPTAIATLIPAHHSLYLEGGVLTGLIAPARCVANCDLVTASPVLQDGPHQLVMPYGGLRYLYLKSASSVQADFRALSTIQIYAHVIVKPLNESGHDIWTWAGQRQSQLPLGFRLGFSAPPFGTCLSAETLGINCIAVGAALGVNPVPRSLLFEVHLGYSVN